MDDKHFGSLLGAVVVLAAALFTVSKYLVSL